MVVMQAGHGFSSYAAAAPTGSIFASTAAALLRVRYCCWTWGQVMLAKSHCIALEKSIMVVVMIWRGNAMRRGMPESTGYLHEKRASGKAVGNGVSL